MSFTWYLGTVCPAALFVVRLSPFVFFLYFVSGYLVGLQIQMYLRAGDVCFSGLIAGCQWEFVLIVCSL